MNNNTFHNDSLKREDNSMRVLVDTLNFHTKLYDEGRPTISDEDWDKMYFRLVKMEKETGVYLKDSPTQKINYQVVNKLTKVEHNHPMLSLDKTKELSEVESFLGDKAYICMGKMDGLTCSLRYLGGKLVSAETRGNGQIGEDILHNALVIKNIPKRIPWNEEFIVDGEIICTYDDFKPFSNEYKNPRNFASGSIRLLDSRECATRNLTFVAWDIINFPMKLLSMKMELLKQYGFTAVPYNTDEGMETLNIELQIEKIQKECQRLGYPIDGVVFKYDFCRAYEEAGRTEHHFKGGLAFKFYDETVETILRDVEWTMGRTGQLTPVAILDPVEIDGTEVSRASLHNISIMKELGITEKGQKVEVFKANMIIPQIKSVVLEPTCDIYSLLNIIEYPEICPICGGNTSIHKENDSEVLYCDNPQCEGKLLNQLEHFTDMKKGVAIKGISKATLEKLIDWGWMEDISDFYTLKYHRDEWIKKEGFGEKSVDNILNAIEESKNCKLENFISAIGIPLIGLSNAKEIAKRVIDFKDLFDKCEHNFKFEEWPGFGYEKAEALRNFDFCYACLTYPLMNITNGESTNYVQTIPGSISLEGMQYCITGKLNIWKNREELTKTIESLGGKVTGSVSKNTTHLINNDINSASAKNKKAHELGIAIITEQMFADIIDFQK